MNRLNIIYAVFEFLSFVVSISLTNKIEYSINVVVVKRINMPIIVNISLKIFNPNNVFIFVILNQFCSIFLFFVLFQRLYAPIRKMDS